MKVLTAYQPGAVCVTPTNSLREAAQRMRSSGQSCLPVLDRNLCVGIITERDLIGAMASGVHAADAHVIDYANDGAVTVSLDDDCEVAESKMLAIGCRNLPVLDGDYLVGMISMRDAVLKARPRTASLVGAAAASPAGWPEEAPPDADSEH